MRRVIAILALALCIAHPGAAPASDDNPPRNIVVTPPSSPPDEQQELFLVEVPEAVLKTLPVYPESARRAGVGGTVMVQALVGKDGWVKDTRIVRSIPLLDSAAAACVRGWRFKPALFKNQPVSVWVAVPVRFDLSGAPASSRAMPEPPSPRGSERGVKASPLQSRMKAPAKSEMPVEQPVIGAFNARLAAAGDSAWARAPATIAIEFVGGADCRCARFTVEAGSPPERFADAEVTVTRDGLLDDSIRGDRYRLRMRRDADGAWRLTAATVAWRCWQGRGNEDYSPDPCK